MAGESCSHVMVAGPELEIAKGKIALHDKSLFVGIVYMRLVDRARRHADQQRLAVIGAIDVQHTRHQARPDLDPGCALGAPGARARQLHALRVDARQNAVEYGGRRHVVAVPLGRIETVEHTLPIRDGRAQAVIGLKPRSECRPRLTAKQAQRILGRKNVFRLYWLRHVCNCPTARWIQLFTVPTGTEESAESSS